jgi:Domain of unknown function (DUF4157)
VSGRAMTTVARGSPGSSRVLQRQARPPARRPAPAAGGTSFNCRTPSDHKHKPTRDWTAQQRRWAARCERWGERLRRGELDPNITRPIECVCAFSSPAQTLQLARIGIGMIPFGLAWRHVDHYLSGGGADYPEDLEDVLRTDSKVRGKLARAIARGGRGCISLSQDEYSVREHVLAFGAIDRMDYQVDPAGGTVHVWFRDRYEWHPESPRVSNCVHRAAVELKDAGAADYWMVGDAVVPRSLFGPAPPTTATPPVPPASAPRPARPAAPPPPPAPPAAQALRRVLAAPATAVQRCGGHPCPASGCDHDGEQLRRSGGQAGGPGARPPAPAIVGEVLRTAGTPLPEGLRRDLGARLDHDFGTVRVHDDERAAESATAVHATAYTVGDHVVLGASAPSLASQDGRRLLAHELVHVLQASGQPAGTGELRVSSPADVSEREADSLAVAALRRPLDGAQKR